MCRVSHLNKEFDIGAKFCWIRTSPFLELGAIEERHEGGRGAHLILASNISSKVDVDLDEGSFAIELCCEFVVDWITYLARGASGGSEKDDRTRISSFLKKNIQFGEF